MDKHGHNTGNLVFSYAYIQKLMSPQTTTLTTTSATKSHSSAFCSARIHWLVFLVAVQALVAEAITSGDLGRSGIEEQYIRIVLPLFILR